MIAQRAAAKATAGLRAHAQSITSLGIRGLAVLMGFGVSFVIGHWFGPAANGTYALVTQSATFLAVVAVGGLDLAVLRQFAASGAQFGRVSTRSLLRVIGYLLALAGMGIVLLSFGGPDFLHWAVGGTLPAHGLLILCIMLVARALTRVASAVLRAQKQYAFGQMVEVLLIPSTTLLAIALGLAATVGAILWVTAIGGLTIGLIGIGCALAGTRRDAAAADVPMRPLLRIALPLWGVAIALNVADWFGLVVVANVLGIYEAGIYRIAVQVGTCFAIISMGLFSVLSPQISAAHALGDTAQVGRLARHATLLSVVFALPPAIMLLLFAEPLLALIGPAFVAAAPMLRIIVVGQILYTITGPAGLVLAMTGHERTNLMVTLISTASLIFVAPFAARAFGAIGVAAYIAAIQVLRNVASAYFVRRYTGVNVMTGHIRGTMDGVSG
jgi:O-antigen/teichoic acid export membrane protein